MTRHRPHPPSPFVVGWIPRIAEAIGAPRSALDLACGRGRHSQLLAGHGFATYAVDIDLARVRAVRSGAPEREASIHAWVANLEQPALPEARFDLVLVTNYLQRDLWPALRRAVARGGYVVYETFTIAQPRHRRGPSSLDHLLRPTELRDAMLGWTILHYAEDDDRDAARARLVARGPR